MSISYIQIYMELIQDLLRPESENLVGFRVWGQGENRVRLH